MSNTIYSDKIKVNCSLVHDENGYYHLVYKIVNIINGKIYVGKHSTKNPYDRYMGSGLGIGRAIKKYGIENFSKEILFCFTNEKEAYLKEESIVTTEFVDRDDTYNMAYGGHGAKKGEENPDFGKKRDKEIGEKISKALKGKYTGENSPFYGKPRTQETKDKISKSHKGKYTGTDSWWYGRHHTQDSKDKISKARKGMIFTKEHRENLSKAHKGKPGYYKGKNLPQDVKDKISNTLKGKMAGEKQNKAKTVLKLDEFGNIIAEYGCMKECCKEENLYNSLLRKLVKTHSLYNGFYFKYKD